LFENSDPFSRQSSKFTPGIFSHDDVKIVDIKKNLITEQQAEELDLLLVQCDQKYKDTIWEALHKSKVMNLNELTLEMYDRLKKATMKKLDEVQNELPF